MWAYMKIQDNTLQTNARHYNTCSTYNAIQHKSIQYNTMQCHTIQLVNIGAFSQAPILEKYTALLIDSNIISKLRRTLGMELGRKHVKVHWTTVQCNTIKCKTLQYNTIEMSKIGNECSVTGDDDTWMWEVQGTSWTRCIVLGTYTDELNCIFNWIDISVN